MITKIFAWIILILSIGTSFDLTAETKEETRAHLFDESQDFVEELKEKGLISKDLELDGYLQSVVKSVIPNELIDNNSLRFYFLRDPMVNAFALPDGSIFVNYGLLARLENEAQLAFILGHEAVHVINEHSLTQKIARRKKVVSANVADLLLFGSGLVYIPTAMSLASHSREHETESDVQGFEFIKSSSYDQNKVLGVFPLLNEVKSADSLKGSAYSSHPGLLEREKMLKEMIQNKRFEVLDNSSFLKMKSKVATETVELKLNLHHYELARDLLENIQKNSTDKIYDYLKAESYRLAIKNYDLAVKEYAWVNDKSLSKSKKYFVENKQSYLGLAVENYMKVLAADPNYTSAYKGLGKTYCEMEKYHLCIDNLSEYVRLDDKAKDKGYVNYLIKKANKKLEEIENGEIE